MKKTTIIFLTVIVLTFGLAFFLLKLSFTAMVVSETCTNCYSIDENFNFLKFLFTIVVVGSSLFIISKEYHSIKKLKKQQ